MKSHRNILMTILTLVLAFPLMAHAQWNETCALGTVTAAPANFSCPPLYPGSQWASVTLTGGGTKTSGPFTATASSPVDINHWFQVSVAFNPTTAGTYSTTINFTYNGNLTLQVLLTGTYAPKMGYINPKYVIVGVTYAPPGPKSNVTYSQSKFVGNTTNTTDSFTQGTNLTVAVTGSIGAWMPDATHFGVKITGSESTEHSQASGTSLSVTFSKQSTAAYMTTGTGNAFSPVNHDYDFIWLWLNPLMIYTVQPNNPTSLQWNGYGYDNHDLPGIDIYGVQVGWLNGHFGSNPSVNAVLARSWVTTNNPGMVWPAGEGPGLTSSDKANILTADPFTGGTYTLPSPLPTTSADGRFTQITYPPNPVTFDQAGLGDGGGLNTMYNTVNINSSIVGQNASHVFTQAFGVEAAFEGGTFLNTFKVDIKTTQTLSWKHTWEHLLTTTKTYTNALSVTGPPCPQTSAPCVPVYRGPGQFIVFQDNLYGTFMFYPK
jgi:hypothetical protein